jgi:hypothetical protein
VDKPVVLRIAETMASVASSQQAAEQVAKFKKQAEDAKTQARGFQVRHPHTHAFIDGLIRGAGMWGSGRADDNGYEGVCISGCACLWVMPAEARGRSLGPCFNCVLMLLCVCVVCGRPRSTSTRSRSTSSRSSTGSVQRRTPCLTPVYRRGPFGY